MAGGSERLRAPVQDQPQFELSSAALLSLPASFLILLSAGPILYALYLGFTKLQLIGPHAQSWWFTGLANPRRLLLDVADGEFLVLLGPSGCGKTTSLRMLAGLERPTYGLIKIGGRTVNTLPSKARDVATVFQSYALFPHKTVRGNLAFGLKVRRVPREQIRQRVDEVAGMLGVGPLLDKRPAQLSGGERQRVALGRALLRRPLVFLMDEPLSNLDAALRSQMRGELIRLHSGINATIVYVTHDQAEAMTMATWIAVMCKGHPSQVDTPQEIYDHPSDLFVACFVGLPKMNIVPGRLTTDQGDPVVEVLGVRVKVDPRRLRAASPTSLNEVVVGIRPEDVLPVSDGVASVAGRVELVEPLGSETLVTNRCGDRATLVARFPARSAVPIGEQIRLGLNTQNLHLFDKVTEKSLLAKLPDTSKTLQKEMATYSS